MVQDHNLYELFQLRRIATNSMYRNWLLYIKSRLYLHLIIIERFALRFKGFSPSEEFHLTPTPDACHTRLGIVC